MSEDLVLVDKFKYVRKVILYEGVAEHGYHMDVIKNDIMYEHDMADKYVEQCMMQIKVMHRRGSATPYLCVRIAKVRAHVAKIAELQNQVLNLQQQALTEDAVRGLFASLDGRLHATFAQLYAFLHERLPGGEGVAGVVGDAPWGVHLLLVSLLFSFWNLFMFAHGESTFCIFCVYVCS